MFTAGSFKKVQFCAVLILALGGMQAGQARAAELGFSVDDIHRQLTEKTDQHFLQKLNECKVRSEVEGGGLPYPVRIAEERAPQGATPGPYSRGRITVM
ncbi:hypothetical protein [Microbulbifer sp. THAF38]|uniref:hypothetical protein n=1 Tax=Microbulbifer sp. THAF38 TaxID=2587856 RepID=UPI001268F287|nr:hypothetical protein [Microbulbifer sp. THAF38]QFT55432.1 hypothetical protein FIU95_12800 [Microbulbifer sp. THAF38]